MNLRRVLNTMLHNTVNIMSSTLFCCIDEAPSGNHGAGFVGISRQAACMYVVVLQNGPKLWGRRSFTNSATVHILTEHILGTLGKNSDNASLFFKIRDAQSIRRGWALEGVEADVKIGQSSSRESYYPVYLAVSAETPQGPERW